MTERHGTPAPPDRSAPSPPGSHPDLEQVAAFVDGRLEGEARQDMIRHLASCDECHELVAETAELLRPEEDALAAGPGAQTGRPGDPAADDQPADARPAGDGNAPGRDGRGRPAGTGKVLRPATGRWLRRLPWLPAIAAAALLVLFLGTLAVDLIRERGAVPVAELAQGLPLADPAMEVALSEALGGHGWPAFRGGEPAVSAEDVRAFQLGVRNAELAATLGALAAWEADSGQAGTAEAGRRPCRLPAGSHWSRSLACRQTSIILRDLEAAPQPALTVASLPYDELQGSIVAGAPAATLQEIQERGDQILAAARGGAGDEGSAPYYLLGQWAGAADLALAAGVTGWFHLPQPRRLLERLAAADFPPPLAGWLGEVERSVGDGGPQPDDPGFRHQLESLITVAGGGDLDAAG